MENTEIMKRIFLVITLMLVVASLAVAQAKASSSSPSDAAAAADPATYVIGPLDVLQISVWKEPEMSTPSVPVRPDGKISLPLLGDIQASGLTPTQLSSVLAEDAKKFVQDPQITVVVTAINSKRVYILGEVGHAGPMGLLPEMSVLQAISSAGGLSQYANAKKIYVLRPVNGAQQRIPFNYKLALKGDAKQDILLQPGDTIIVP